MALVVVCSPSANPPPGFVSWLSGAAIDCPSGFAPSLVDAALNTGISAADAVELSWMVVGAWVLSWGVVHIGKALRVR